jgi:NADH dehydrogenase (ubiquinone) Fe-S protein 1
VESTTTPTSVACTINDRVYHVYKNSTILKACEQSGLLVPRFCYHDRLSIAGNCRMCLVQLDKALKPVASCALEVLPGMKIFTNTALVKKAREGVMEFLLANHPLDCPICDQGGECDLQDQALVFGNDRGRFYEVKRAVADKNWGHLIKTIMTRCIHCTRCQRFSTELSGQPEVLMVGRGVKSEISSFITQLVKSEVSGNVIDLCPVGALTSKPYAFTARPWELTKVVSIDLSDALHSNLSYQINQQRVLRVLPILNMELNEEWLSDRARFLYDGYRLQRLMQPFVFSKGTVLQLTWFELLEGLFFQIGPFFGFSFAISEVSFQSSYPFWKLNSFGGMNTADVDQRNSYLLSENYAGISTADLVILVGLNLKRELPLLSVRLRFEQSKRALQIIQFGNSDLGFKTLEGGASHMHFLRFLEGRHTFSSIFSKAKKPVVLLNPYIDVFPTRDLLTLLNSDLLFGVIPNAGSVQGNLAEFGTSTKIGSIFRKSFSALFVNNLQYLSRLDATGSPIYIGSHGSDALINPSFFVCPISSAIEEEALHLNLEGRLQLSGKIFTVPSSKHLSYVLTVLLSVFGSFERGWGLLSQVVDLTINEPYCASFFLTKKGFGSTCLLPFFSFVSASYSTISVTYVSPLLVESTFLEQKTAVVAFPERF